MPAIGNILTYQLGAFFAGGLLEPNSRSMLELVPRLLNAGKEFAPSLVHQLSNAAATATLGPRLRFELAETGQIIDYGAGRIDVQAMAIAPARQVAFSLEDFCNEAKALLELLWPTGQLAHRLTLISNVMSDELEEGQFSNALSSLVILNDLYTADVTKVWELRLGAKRPVEINGREEVINHISKVSRQNGQMMDTAGVESFERLFLETDVNTSELMTDQRFNVGSVDEFLLEARRITELLHQTRFINI